MKILKIGRFDSEGMPLGWVFDCHGGAGIDLTGPGVVFACLELDRIGDGVVSVNGVEIVEWTEARRAAMHVTEPA